MMVVCLTGLQLIPQFIREREPVVSGSVGNPPLVVCRKDLTYRHCDDSISCYAKPLDRTDKIEGYAISHYQTLSYDPISCYGNSVERTSEIKYIVYEFLPSRTTESDSGSGPFSSWAKHGSHSSGLSRGILFLRC